MNEIQLPNTNSIGESYNTFNFWSFGEFEGNIPIDHKLSIPDFNSIILFVDKSMLSKLSIPNKARAIKILGRYDTCRSMAINSFKICIHTLINSKQPGECLQNAIYDFFWSMKTLSEKCYEQINHLLDYDRILPQIPEIVCTKHKNIGYTKAQNEKINELFFKYPPNSKIPKDELGELAGYLEKTIKQIYDIIKSRYFALRKYLENPNKRPSWVPEAISYEMVQQFILKEKEINK